MRCSEQPPRFSVPASRAIWMRVVRSTVVVGGYGSAFFISPHYGCQTQCEHGGPSDGQNRPGSRCDSAVVQQSLSTARKRGDEICSPKIMSEPIKNIEVKLDAAVKAGRNHRKQVEASLVCGCYHCLKTFAPSLIFEWTEPSQEGLGQTAICPHCGTNAVVGSNAGFPLTPEFLEAVNLHWFFEGI